MGKQLTQEDFIRRSIERHGSTRYDYSGTKFVRTADNVDIKCNKCNHIFSQQAATHLDGHGCPRCSKRERMTTGRFIELAKEKYGDTYDYSKSISTGNKKKLKIICKIHGEFNQTPEMHLHSIHGCPKCGKDKADRDTVNFDEFVARSENKHGEYMYEYFEPSYTRTHNKTIILCRTCNHVFYQQAKSHMQGQGCPRCSGLVKTTEDVIRDATIKHGDRYDYSSTVHKKGCNKITVICREHGPFCVNVFAHVSRGDGCPKCSRNSKKTFVEFVKKARAVHGNKYIYREEAYKGTSFKTEIKCSICGNSFEQSCSNHLIGQGCPFCAGKYGRTDEEVKESVESYGYSLVSYGGKEKSVSLFRCQHGHEWKTSTYNVSRGNTGCPICSNYGPSPEYTKNFYLLRIAAPDAEYIGFGITGDLYKRMNTHTRNIKKNGLKILDVKYAYFEEDGLAHDIENEVLSIFKKDKKLPCEGFLRESGKFSLEVYNSLYSKIISSGGVYSTKTLEDLQQICL